MLPAAVRGKSDWLPPLGDEWLPEHAHDLRLHNSLVALRDKWAAHTDKESGRSLEDVGALMGDDAPTFAASWRDGILPDVLPRIERLCDKLALSLHSGTPGSRVAVTEHVAAVAWFGERSLLGRLGHYQATEGHAPRPLLPSTPGTRELKSVPGGIPGVRD